MLWALFVFTVQGLLCAGFVGGSKVEQVFGGQEGTTIYTETCLDQQVCLPPAYSRFAPLKEDNSTYMATVEFQSFDKKLYQVHWDLFCRVFNGSSSLKSVFERHLWAGDDRGVFLIHNSEVQRAFTSPSVGLFV